MFEEKQKYLRGLLTTKKISLRWHDATVSFLEGVLARGDRRLCAVIEGAFRRGCKRDAWSEHFDMQIWLDAMEECGLDPLFYAGRRRNYDEIMPWDHLDYGVPKNFLIKENKLAHEGITTPNCRRACSGCGAAAWGKGVCAND